MNIGDIAPGEQVEVKIIGHINPEGRATTDSVEVVRGGIPRVWKFPPEPGPEVTRVSDYSGEVWRRVPGGWVPKGWVPEDAKLAGFSSKPATWEQLGWFAPLTDVSDQPEDTP